MSNKNITDITRKDIFVLFIKGYIDNSCSLFGECGERIMYAYNGGVSELDFLGELYDLKNLPSKDIRFNNAYDDIYQHTINNDDWNLGWVFNDSRFKLIDCKDEEFLKFLCRVFHPSVRNEDGSWKGMLERIQVLLRPDGYELYVVNKISGRDIYAWRELTDIEIASNRFIPFSQRYKNRSLQVPSINIKKRKALVELMYRFEENILVTNDTGWQEYKCSHQIVMDEIKEFYSPKAFNDKNEYVEENNFEKFVMHTLPKYVFDVIELYSRFKYDKFSYDVNIILSDIGYKLMDGKMMPVQNLIKAEMPKEQTLRDLLLDAESNYKKQDIDSIQRALEKVWDAFERIKTYYTGNKKDSLLKILQKISNGDASLENRLNAEFKELTDVGNKYQIRHFETNKLPITDIRMKEYWYTRCLALINLVIRFVEK